MSDLGLEEMFSYQRELNEKYAQTFGALSPDAVKEKLLWATIELSEAADIIKKHGANEVAADDGLRAAYAEELCDTAMYLIETAECLGITPEQLGESYINKHRRNMNRW